MFKDMKALPKALILGVIVVGAIFGGRAVFNTDMAKAYTSAKATVPVSVPDKIDLPTAVAGAVAPVSGTSIAGNATGSIRVKTIPWNGTLGMMHAKASGAYKARGLDVTIGREDDYAKLIADMAAFAKDPSQGSHFVIIMGDGLPAWVIGANEALKPFGASAAMIAGIGYSRGEDKCIIDSEADPRGSLIAGYLGDGDINICIKYAADNGIPVNSDPKTYDPKAMNFLGTGSFVEADEKFIASAKSGFKGGACEERTLVGGGGKQRVCVNGTATWTPGDSKVFAEMAKLKRSIKVIGSTKEYAWQMPTAVIGNKQWMAKNPEIVKAFLAATFESGEKVRSDNAALMIAATEQAKVTGEQDASYWASMFKGVVETGPNGKPISLGGSTTNGIADAGYLFGLNGADDLFKKVYTVYGNIAVKYFPDIMPGGLQPYEAVVDKSYVQALLSASTNVAKATTPTFGVTTETFAARSMSIEFDSGKTTFKPSAVKVLNQVLDDAAVTGLSVQINGHTDNIGDPASNLSLSKARAEVVKQFLMTNAPSTFPAERVTTRGFGDTQPIGTNAQNRRVEIVLRK